MYTEFWWENLREIEQLEDPGVDGGLIGLDLSGLK
jgi:hypothetical protein